MTAGALGGCPYQSADSARPDPCADYIPLRSGDPVVKDEILGVWMVTGYEETARLLRSSALSSAWPAAGRTVLHEHMSGDGGSPRTSDTVRRWFMFDDGPEHVRLRRLVSPLFTAERVERTRPYVRATVETLLEEARTASGGRETLDVMTGLAVPLSSRVICHLLGLGEEMAPRLPGWAHDIAALLLADYRPQVTGCGDAALAEVAEVVEAAAARSDLPDDCGIALLRRALRAGEIEPADVVATASLLMYAGFETTSTFIGKAVRAVLHTGTWQTVIAEGAGAAVEELLRFDTSVQQVARIAVRPVDVAGRRIEAGDLVLLLLGVAHRDTRSFPSPDHLLPGRHIGRHLAFGLGRHYCLGAGLARLQARVVLEELAARWGRLEPAAPAVVRSHNGVTVLESLAVRGSDETR
ncbi:cytochrome P450 [Streptomyces albus]|uniref:cytochrome P450 n=1 Tax=Streptomyces albus TaxID=1888 RepID=UPI00340DDC71